jgi:ATP-dependent helicase/nuclease subunit A
MSAALPPVDHEARRQAREDHGASLVLEAGAGTGKTTLLIDRIETLVRAGHARLTEIAAVTFTENAATTMKLRLRERLERARSDPAGPEPERRRAAEALDVLERAQVSTIHALCAAILSERPLECGVLPGFRTADEAEADLLFAAAWEEWLAERLVKGDDVLLEALDHDIPLEGMGPFGERSSLRGFARALIEQRDLRPLVAEAPEDPQAWRRDLEAHAERARVVLALAPHGDTLTSRLEDLVAFADQPATDDPAETARRLLKMPAIPGNVRGLRARWPRADILEEARAIADWSRQALTRWRAAHGAALHGRIMAALQGVGERYARLKAERGVLDYLDLLLKARDALRDREPVRRYFRERFRLLIIDEFQDTDPLQVQIARLLAGDAPGALVVVGDAKQSIYRFRRAEVALFRRLSEEARHRDGHRVLHLTQNFRSRPAILRFVNRAFGALIKESDDADQPAYETIDPPAGLGEEPSVIALRFEAPHAEGADLLLAESAATAALIAQVAAGRYEVRDPATGAERKSRAGDVMVLTRRLTQVRHLEEALEAAGLRFAVEGGKSFFDRQEVHETLAVLRAIEDPTDRVSLVAALRSSFFGVSDRDIVTYALAGGPLWIGPVDETKPAAAALGPAMALLDDLHKRRTRDSVPAILDVLYDETRILAALTGTRRGEAQIANLEKVAALARQASELGVLTLRGFAELLQTRILEPTEEPDLPATRPGDPSTVRVLSIHKAKGLEAPVVVLFDTADSFRITTESVALWEEERIALGFRAGCQPPGWDALVTADQKKAWAEGHRLKYVACTRARDLLVIPVPPPDARAGAFWRELTQFLPRATDADVQVVDASTLPAPVRETDDADLRTLAGAAGGDAVAARWDAERKERIETASHRPFVPISATRAAARTAPAAAVSAISGGGRDFGGLVHRILEWVPLEPEAAPGLAVTMAAALGPTFGLDAEGARRAGDAAQRALDLPVMHRARKAAKLWRELPVWFPDGADLIEGVVDLVFEEEGGLVIVDYKTDHIADDQALAQAAHHAPQLQLYGRGLAQATGLPVRERLVLFTALGRTVPV